MAESSIGERKEGEPALDVQAEAQRAAEISLPAASSAAGEGVPAAAVSAAASSTLFSAAPNNSAEAADALELGRMLAAEGVDLARAERVLAKAVRLQPTTESMQLLASVQRRRAAEEQPGAHAAPRAAAAAAASVAPQAAAPAEPAPAHAAAADEVPGAAAALSSLLTWRRCTLTAPSFLQPPARPGVPARSVSFSYPAVLYVPPAQRRPLLVVWSLAALLLCGRLLGMMEPSHDPFIRPSRRHRYSSQREPSQQQSHHRYDPYGDASETRSDSGYTHADDSTQHYEPSFFNLNNVLTMLPFIFFFLIPMLQRHQAQRR